MSSNSPLVSVVMPSFNDARFVGEALDSILAQTYPEIEIIVVDDGSTDTTCDIVAGYGSRVRLIRQANQGSAVARNAGIRAAQGHYVAFLDADDCWHPEKLRLQVDAMQAQGYAMAYSRFIVWAPDEAGRFTPAVEQFSAIRKPPAKPLVTGWVYTALLMDCIVWTSTVIVERSALLAAGLFDPQLRKGQDYDLWLRLSRSLPMFGLEQATALYRVNRASVTHRLSETCYEYDILSRALAQWGAGEPGDVTAPAAQLLRQRQRKMLLNHGLAHAAAGNDAVAASTLALSLRKHGLQWKPLLHLAQLRLKGLLARLRMGRGQRTPLPREPTKPL